MLRDVEISARQADAVLGEMGVGRPDLLAVDHPLVAVAVGPRDHAREIRSRARFGHELAPHLSAVQDRRDVLMLVRVRHAREQQIEGGPARAREVRRKLIPGGFLVEDLLVALVKAGAAQFRRQRDAGVAAFAQLRLDRTRPSDPFALGLPVGRAQAMGRGAGRSEVGGEPSARPLAVLRLALDHGQKRTL